MVEVQWLIHVQIFIKTQYLIYIKSKSIETQKTRKIQQDANVSG